MCLMRTKALGDPEGPRWDSPPLLDCLQKPLPWSLANKPAKFLRHDIRTLVLPVPTSSSGNQAAHRRLGWPGAEVVAVVPVLSSNSHILTGCRAQAGGFLEAQEALVSRSLRLLESLAQTSVLRGSRARQQWR